jgi:serine protease Do
MSAITELEQGARTVAERVGPAVVGIGRDARGSGVVLAPGRVLTNAHNLRDRTTSVTFADGRSVQGSVAGVDSDGDLAVIEVDTGDAAPVPWAPPEAVSSGSLVYAAARAHAGLRVTFGLVTGTEQSFRGPRGRRIRGSIEHTAPLARGSSGGPVLDGEGRLVALNTRRLGDGFYQAIPADQDLRSRVDALASGDSPSRPRLGVAVAPPEVARRLRRAVGLAERDGLLLRSVQPDGPAARAGLRTGDLLVAAAGQPLPHADALYDALDAAGTAGTLELRVVRGTDDLTVTVQFGEPPSPEPAAG